MDRFTAVGAKVGDPLRFGLWGVLFVVCAGGGAGGVGGGAGFCWVQDVGLDCVPEAGLFAFRFMGTNELGLLFSKLVMLEVLPTFGES